MNIEIEKVITETERETGDLKSTIFVIVKKKSKIFARGGDPEHIKNSKEWCCSIGIKYFYSCLISYKIMIVMISN